MKYLCQILLNQKTDLLYLPSVCPRRECKQTPVSKSQTLTVSSHDALTRVSPLSFITCEGNVEGHGLLMVVGSTSFFIINVSQKTLGLRIQLQQCELPDPPKKVDQYDHMYTWLCDNDLTSRTAEHFEKLVRLNTFLAFSIAYVRLA